MPQKIRDPNWMTHLWERVLSMFGGLDTRVTALEQGGGGGGGDVNVIESISFNGDNVPPDASKRVSLVEGDPTVPAWAKAATKPVYTALEVKALPDPVKLTYADLTKADNDIPAGTAADFKAILVQDKNGKPVGYIIVQALNDGKTAIGVYAGNYVNGSSLAGGMRIIMDKAGSWSYQIANPAGFRSAIEAQQDVGLYIDAQGYICQRIGSDT